MGKNMKDNQSCALLKGCVPEEKFELLISFTSIRSEPLISALKDHLCNGLSQSDSACKYMVSQSLLSRRLAVLNDINQKAGKIARFYLLP